MKHDAAVGVASTVLATVTVPESLMGGLGRLLAAVGTAALAAVVNNLVQRLMNRWRSPAPTEKNK